MFHAVPVLCVLRSTGNVLSSPAVEDVLVDVVGPFATSGETQISQVFTDSCPSNNLIATCGNGRNTQTTGHIFWLEVSTAGK